jgi:hypothetical protein
MQEAGVLAQMRAKKYEDMEGASLYILAGTHLSRIHYFGKFWLRTK